MKKHGILNSSIGKILCDLGHTDQITISDCGLPVSDNVEKIDVSLDFNVPKFIDVLKIVTEEMKVEKIILAEEIKMHNPEVLSEIERLLPEVEVEWVTHEHFKELTHNSKCVIRTGEATPYANIILQSGVIF